MQLSVLMPVFNEAATVRQAVAEVMAADLPGDWELIVVDDGSTDGTAELLAGIEGGGRVIVLTHDRNRGKGAAIRTALVEARGEFAAVFDADLEYRAADLRRVLEPLTGGQADVVFGARTAFGLSSHSLLYALGNRFVTLVARRLFDAGFSDVMTCHKALRTSTFRSLGLSETGFAVEAEIAARLVQRGEAVLEVPVRYVARASDAGKKLGPADGLRVLRTLVRCRLRPTAPRSARRWAHASRAAAVRLRA